jgi:hypothetical protein
MKRGIFTGEKYRLRSLGAARFLPKATAKSAKRA